MIDEFEDGSIVASDQALRSPDTRDRSRRPGST
jgi:hypothetical protein